MKLLRVSHERENIARVMRASCCVFVYTIGFVCIAAYREMTDLAPFHVALFFHRLL